MGVPRTPCRSGKATDGGAFTRGPRATGHAIDKLHACRLTRLYPWRRASAGRRQPGGLSCRRPRWRAAVLFPFTLGHTPPLCSAPLRCVRIHSVRRRCSSMNLPAGVVRARVRRGNPRKLPRPWRRPAKRPKAGRLPAIHSSRRHDDPARGVGVTARVDPRGASLVPRANDPTSIPRRGWRQDGRPAGRRGRLRTGSSCRTIRAPDGNCTAVIMHARRPMCSSRLVVQVIRRAVS